MNSLLDALIEVRDICYKFLREENKRRSMPPKEYGVMLQKKRRKKNRK